jgi:hypothetical protein
MWHTNAVYADTRMVKGDEVFSSMTKIHGLKKPIDFISEKREITDRIFGWYCSGAVICGQALFEYLENGSPNVDLALQALIMAERFNLANYDNFFELILIGEKANYSVGWQPGGHRLEVYEHDRPFVLGSGKNILLDLLETTPDIHPLRAMYATFYRDRMSGGMVEVWHLEPKSEHSDTRFYRLGIGEERTDEEIAPLLLDLTAPMPLDFIKPTDRMRAVLEFLEKKDAEKEAEEKSKAQAKKARKAVRHKVTTVITPKKRKKKHE